MLCEAPRTYKTSRLRAAEGLVSISRMRLIQFYGMRKVTLRNLLGGSRNWRKRHIWIKGHSGLDWRLDKGVWFYSLCQVRQWTFAAGVCLHVLEPGPSWVLGKWVCWMTRLDVREKGLYGPWWQGLFCSFAMERKKLKTEIVKAEQYKWNSTGFLSLLLFPSVV